MTNPLEEVLSITNQLLQPGDSDKQKNALEQKLCTTNSHYNEHIYRVTAHFIITSGSHRYFQ